MQSFTCANCGGSIQVENQFIRTVTCKFCQSSYLVRGTDSLDPTGKSASLANYPSRIQVGARGQLKGRGFHVIGRVRYTYDGGFWEEFQIGWDDGAPPDWIEEDEGYWTLYKRERVKSAMPDFNSVRVGSTVAVNQYQVYVTEKRIGQVAGTDGQFASALPLSGTFGYFQGAANNRTVSINYWSDEIELSVGDDLDPSDITFS